jgi:hypothetical protein
MVILMTTFATIVVAVEQGRIIYSNIDASFTTCSHATCRRS